ncbi:MAG: flagellar protein FlaG [Deltaproteobacteria bacterium]
MKIEGQGSAVNLAAQTVNEVIKPQEKPIPATSGQEHKEPKQAPKNEAEVVKATEVLNETMKIYNYHLEFKVHKGSGRMQVKVVDSDSQKVIREIPPESILDCAARIRELLNNMAGILVDEVV